MNRLLVAAVMTAIACDGGSPVVRDAGADLGSSADLAPAPCQAERNACVQENASCAALVKCSDACAGDHACIKGCFAGSSDSYAGAYFFCLAAYW